MESWDSQHIYVDENMNHKKRKVTGSYFTPIPLAESIGECVLFQWIKKHPQWQKALPWVIALLGPTSSMGAFDYDEKESFVQALSHLKVGDLAAGSGVFLLTWVATVEKIYDAVYREGLNHKDKVIFLKRIFNGIYAVDIELESLNAFEKVMIERWGIKNQAHLMHKNALDDELPQLLPKFDIILGNPPYIGEKNNRETFDAIKHTQLYKRHYQAKMDYYYFFIYRGFECLKPTGIMANLITSYFITADGASDLRKFVTDQAQIAFILDFENSSLFDSAKGHHSTVLALQHKNLSDQSIGVLKIGAGDLKCQSHSFFTAQNTKNHYYINTNEVLTANGYLSFEHPQTMALYHKISERSQVTLDEMYDINQGIVSGCDRIKEEGSEQGVFVLTPSEVSALKIEPELLRPFYKNSHIDAYHCNDLRDPDLQIIYIPKTIDDFENKYPYTWQHLSKHKEKLSKRRECMMGVRPWYALQWPRLESLFESSKLVVPHRSPSNRFAWSTGPFYGSADIYYLTRKESVSFAYQESVMLGLLNSKLFYYLLRMGGKRKGKLLELYATPLKKLPVSVGDKDVINRIDAIVKKLVALASKVKEPIGTEWETLENALNQEVYLLYGLQSNEVEQIELYNKLVMK